MAEAQQDTQAPTDVEATGAARVSKRQTGEVVAVSGAKTIRVDVNRKVQHPMYGKYIRRRTRLLVHDEANEAGEGDAVEIAPCRRISKRKSWRLVRIIRRAALGRAGA